MSTTIVLAAFMLNGRFAPVPSVEADNCTGDAFSICSITVDCNGQGQVYFTGSIPQGGFTLELMDKAANNAGSFIETAPNKTIITITSGTSPVSYSLPLTYWNPPHMRVDSNYNTKSPSIYCSGAGVTPTTEITPTVTVTPTATPSATPAVTVTPTVTTTPTVTPTVTVTPTPTTDPCANNACVTPTPTATPTPTSTNSGNGGSSSGGSSSSSTTTTQAVLGASTMAETGTFTENLMNILLIAGIISLAAGSLSYAKENRN